jgi:putative DNA primase/helicase
MTPSDLLQTLRYVHRLRVQLAPSGTIVIRPKTKLPPDLAPHLVEHRNDLVALLQAERTPAPREPGDTRPSLRGSVTDLKTDAEQAWAVLRRTNTPERIFRAAAGMAWIESDVQGRPVIQPLDDPRLRHYLAQIIYFVTERVQGDAVAEVAVPPPSVLVKDLLATPEPPLPPLLRIVTTPIITASGRLHDRPGYDAESRSFYAPPAGFVLPPVAPTPASTDVASARAALDEVIVDFPFITSADRTHTFAALLSLFARDLIAGPCPLIMFAKPAPGTGASLLVESLIRLGTGHEPSGITEAHDEDEWRKRITSTLMTGSMAVFLDNIRGHLDSGKLSAALTLATWEDRVLGRSENARIPIQCVWLGTANNATFSNELARRIVRVNLDAEVERPWLRARDGLVTFRHPDLRGWITAERPRLVHAALTLVMAWLAKGRPDGAVEMGSYEAWSKVLGGILDVAGVKGFLSNLDDVYDSGDDTETDDTKRFLARWWETHRDHPKTPAELFAIANQEDVALPLTGKDDHARRISLGRYLQRQQGRAFDLSIGTVVPRRRPDEGRPTWRLMLRPRPVPPVESWESSKSGTPFNSHTRVLPDGLAGKTRNRARKLKGDSNDSRDSNGNHAGRPWSDEPSWVTEEEPLPESET